MHLLADIILQLGYFHWYHQTIWLVYHHFLQALDSQIFTIWLLLLFLWAHNYLLRGQAIWTTEDTTLTCHIPLMRTAAPLLWQHHLCMQEISALFWDEIKVKCTPQDASLLFQHVIHYHLNFWLLPLKLLRDANDTDIINGYTCRAVLWRLP